MLWLKACPRCGGDIYEDREGTVRYASCLQCGHVLTEQQEVQILGWRSQLGPYDHRSSVQHTGPRMLSVLASLSGG
jgi:transcription initiation factor TFIIIB Brf1 subunit/transcription initiation factor TFIIB